MYPLLVAFVGAVIGIGGFLAVLWMMRVLVRPADPVTIVPGLAEAMRALARDGAHVRMEPIAAGDSSRFASNFNAMAQALEQRENALREIAQVDSETGLLTRRALQTVLDDLPEPDGRPRFVAAVRVERFIPLRQNIGYPLASSLIREVGLRAQRAVPGARVGRLGTATIGVGFAAADLAEATASIGAMRAGVERELEIAGHFLDVACIIGFATSDGPELGAGTLIEQAELAADQAEHSRSRLAMFRIDKFGDPSERLALMRDLRGALRNGDIFLCYQPKLRSRTDEIDAIEALIRWRHPTRGMIAPDQFIALAEEMGEIRAVTEWVLRQAARDQVRLAAAGLPLTVYVNISGRLLGDSQFAECALLLAKDFVCPLGFEITETSVIFDPEGALRDLTAFAAAGIRIAIDDYGSGWSSLAYLKKLPAHELKIDRLFISDLTFSHRDPLLVRSTIDLAHALGLEVTAEGVDQPSSLALLRVMGCDLIQGFLIAPPMPVEELESFLLEHRYLANIDVQSPSLSRTTIGYW
jgi:EAL domain-containing protein (putative c-di-GMP-specific phosphodiesterase class I)/GGDEF domain-containing protein